MKKLIHYPSVWQAYPFSMDMFAHFEKDARIQGKEKKAKKQRVKKEGKSKLKLAFGW